MNDVVKALYFFLPAMFANMSPLIIAKLGWFSKLNVSIDKLIHAPKPLFGSHKTLRGFVSGVTVALIIGFIQYALNRSERIIDYELFPKYHELLQSLTLAFLLGFGALIGDLVKSYLKRKIGIPPGKRWFGPDQFDYTLGGLILSMTVFVPRLEIIILLLFFGPFLHLLSTIVGKLLKIRDDWY